MDSQSPDTPMKDVLNTILEMMIEQETPEVFLQLSHPDLPAAVVLGIYLAEVDGEEVTDPTLTH